MQHTPLMLAVNGNHRLVAPNHRSRVRDYDSYDNYRNRNYRNGSPVRGNPVARRVIPLI